jgi:hypothetical protein
VKKNPFRLGYTGPQAGMTLEQKHQLTWKFRDFYNWSLASFNGTIEANHGGCIGGDFEFDQLCVFFELEIMVHPATNVAEWKKARYEGSYGRRSFTTGGPALARDRGMAKWCDFLIATPAEFVEIQRSGVWATIRYYLAEHKNVYIIYPDGSTEKR